MSMGIKSPAGTPDIAIHSVHVVPSTTTKTITHNGTYNASSDNADGYSAVTVNVPQQSEVPQDMTIKGITVDSWWESGTDYLYRAMADHGESITDRGCIRAGTMVKLPKGYTAQVTCDLDFIEISGEYINANGTVDTAAKALNIGWSTQPKVISVPQGSDYVFFTPLFRRPNNEPMVATGYCPTECYIHFVANS